MPPGCTEYTDCRVMLGFRPWWISGPKDLEVVGESHYQPQIAYAAGHLEEALDVAPIFVTLLAELNNPYDENAVAVFSGDAHVGYLGRYEAPDYQPFLLALQEKGVRAVCHATVHGLPLDEDDKDDWDGFQRISLETIKAEHILLAQQPLAHNGSPTVLAPGPGIDLHWVEHHQQTIGRVVGTLPVRDFSWFVSLRKVATNPYNPGFHNWVVAEANEGVVGYLPLHESARYAQQVNSFARGGQTPNCSAVTYWNARGYWQTSVYLPNLPQP